MKTVNRAAFKVQNLKKRQRDIIAKCEDGVDEAKAWLRKAKKALAVDHSDTDTAELILSMEDSLKSLKVKRDRAYNEMQELLSVDTCVRFCLILKDLIEDNLDFKIFFSQNKIRQYFTRDIGDMLYAKED